MIPALAAPAPIPTVNVVETQVNASVTVPRGASDSIKTYSVAITGAFTTPVTASSTASCHGV